MDEDLDSVNDVERADVERVDEEQLDEVLMVLEGESTEGLLRACDLFRSGVPDRFRDIDDAARASHSLRGSAGAFGARRLSTMGERLEERCREADGAAAVPIVDQMRAEFLAFRDILDARLAELTRGSYIGRLALHVGSPESDGEEDGPCLRIPSVAPAGPKRPSRAPDGRCGPRRHHPAGHQPRLGVER